MSGVEGSNAFRFLLGKIKAQHEHFEDGVAGLVEFPEEFYGGFAEAGEDVLREPDIVLFEILL